MASLRDGKERWNPGQGSRSGGGAKGAIESRSESPSGPALTGCSVSPRPFVRLFSPADGETRPPILPKRRTDYGKVHLHVP